MRISSDDRTLIQALGPLADEGVEDDREKLLLWLLRNQLGVGAADSYEYVLSTDEYLSPNIRVDAAIVIAGRELLTSVYILLADSPDDLVARLGQLTESLKSSSQPEREFSKRSSHFRSIFEAAISRGRLEVTRTILCVCLQELSNAQRARIAKSSRDEDASVDVFDLNFLRALAKAEAQPTERVPSVKIPTHDVLDLDLGKAEAHGVIVAVKAVDVAGWPGIEDRSLFDLNVRHALGVNKVRRSLDKALTDPTSVDEFIAYHNGLTAVCDSFTKDNAGLIVEGLSVVNGAQSVVAIHANAEGLSPQLKLLLKLIATSPDSNLARNIAIRSNTQNPVTSRNLRALDPVQERLSQALAQRGYLYVVKANDGTPSNARVIRNDDVAQLLCAIYVRKPALAVKRQLLFENPQYQEIFPETLEPARVIFAHLTRRAVDAAFAGVPDPYRRAWALTALTLCYMTAEAMRSDMTFVKKLEQPQVVVNSAEQLQADMKPFVDAAVRTLVERRANFDSSPRDDEDDFKVAFKQTRTLTELGMKAARVYRAQVQFGQD